MSSIDGDDLKEADRELRQWGRHVNDGWLASHLLYTPPPTSEGYVAPVVGYDDPEPAQPPIDEIAAGITEKIVVHIGLECFTSFQVLVHWYCHANPNARPNAIESAHDVALKRLSKKMHTSVNGAQRMLDEARYRYWLHRELQKLTQRPKVA